MENFRESHYILDNACLHPGSVLGNFSLKKIHSELDNKYELTCR